MNTRGIAREYRLSHWAAIIRERQESGLSVKAFCERAGFHANNYFYWQKKLREAACEGLAKTQSGAMALTAPVFAEVKLPGPPALPPVCGDHQTQICVEVSGMRLTAWGEYPIDKLAELLRELNRSCC